VPVNELPHHLSRPYFVVGAIVDDTVKRRLPCIEKNSHSFGEKNDACQRLKALERLWVMVGN